MGDGFGQSDLGSCWKDAERIYVVGSGTTFIACAMPIF